MLILKPKRNLNGSDGEYIQRSREHFMYSVIKSNKAYYKTWPGPIGLAPILASNLASTQILAWPQKLAWLQIWPVKFSLASNKNNYFLWNLKLFVGEN
jgi:hypothetical protein